MSPLYSTGIETPDALNIRKNKDGTGTETPDQPGLFARFPSSFRACSSDCLISRSSVPAFDLTRVALFDCSCAASVVPSAGGEESGCWLGIALRLSAYVSLFRTAHEHILIVVLRFALNRYVMPAAGAAGGPAPERLLDVSPVSNPLPRFLFLVYLGESSRGCS